MKTFSKTSPSEGVTTQGTATFVAGRGLGSNRITRYSHKTDTAVASDEIGNDPLSRAQILASIRAAKRLHLPTGEVLRAIRRQIDED